jgi:ribose/xylose/arabinose/galactoside ABC-type transport system permease subunit
MTVGRAPIMGGVPGAGWLSRLDTATLGPAAALVLMFVAYSALSPNFLTVQNITNVLVQSAPLLILATGQTFALLMGGLDLSQGSIVSLVSVVTASVLMEHGLLLGSLSGLGVGLAVGLTNGLLVGRARIQPFIVTLGMLYIAAGAAMVYSRGSAIFGLPRPEVDHFFWFGGGYLGPVPVPVLIAGVLVVLAHLLLTRTRAGRHIYAIGGNEQVAVMSGINVSNVKTLIFTISGGLAGIGGYVLSARVISGQPLLGSGELLLQSIGAVIIGGTSIFGGEGGVLRTVVGVLVIAFMVNGLNLLAISTFIQQIIVGAIIILSVWANALRRRRS